MRIIEHNLFYWFDLFNRFYWFVDSVASQLKIKKQIQPMEQI